MAINGAVSKTGKARKTADPRRGRRKLFGTPISAAANIVRLPKFCGSSGEVCPAA